MSDPIQEPTGLGSHTPKGEEATLQKTLRENWDHQDRKNLEYFLRNRHQALCTLGYCARTHPWPVRGTLHPWLKGSESHARKDLQQGDYSECVHCKGAGGQDGGLFSGETSLHIAIVQHKLDSIEWLLDHGAHLDDRALGIFFQSPRVPKLRHPMSTTSIKKFLLTLHENEMMFLTGDAGEPNQSFSGCNYGEFPLSFASAVGDDHVCHLLIDKYDERIKTMMRDITSTSFTFLNAEMLAGKSRNKVPHACPSCHLFLFLFMCIWRRVCACALIRSRTCMPSGARERARSGQPQISGALSGAGQQGAVVRRLSWLHAG